MRIKNCNPKQPWPILEDRKLKRKGDRLCERERERERELVGAPAAAAWKTGAVAKPNAEARAKGRGSGSLAIDWTVTMWIEYCTFMGGRRWRGCCIYWPTTSSFISHALNEIGLFIFLFIYLFIYLFIIIILLGFKGRK